MTGMNEWEFGKLYNFDQLAVFQFDYSFTKFELHRKKRNYHQSLTNILARNNTTKVFCQQ